jgi:hypothetical protein
MKKYKNIEELTKRSLSRRYNEIISNEIFEHVQQPISMSIDEEDHEVVLEPQQNLDYDSFAETYLSDLSSGDEAELDAGDQEESFNIKSFLKDWKEDYGINSKKYCLHLLMKTVRLKKNVFFLKKYFLFFLFIISFKAHGGT